VTGAPDRQRRGSQGGDNAAVVRVVLADDQSVVREGLVTLLSLLPGIEVVGAGADGDEALRLVDEHRPDVLLVDLKMPRRDGVSTTSAVRAEYPDTEVVVLTTYADDDSLLAALRAGARGFLTKDADAESIAHALRSAAAGLSIVDGDLQERLVASVGTPRPARRPDDGLTPREVDVLQLIAAGLSNGEIARHLVVSEATVKTHVNHVFSKLGLRDRAQAVSYAYRTGLVQP
jgi:DNA-binding NarL/FixJ family response regulator